MAFSERIRERLAEESLYALRQEQLSARGK
jgi:hypothetical protein